MYWHQTQVTLRNCALQRFSRFFVRLRKTIPVMFPAASFNLLSSVHFIPWCKSTVFEAAHCGFVAWSAQ